MLDDLISKATIHSTIPPITEVYHILNNGDMFTAAEAEKYEANKHLFIVDKKYMSDLITSLNRQTDDDLKSVILLYENGNIKPIPNVAKNWKP